MITKEKILSALKELPDSFAAEDLIERIVLLEKVERGLSDLDQGQVFTFEQIEAEYLTK